MSRLGALPADQKSLPATSLNPLYGCVGSCCSSVGTGEPGARNVTVCTTRWLKTHFTLSPTWIVTRRRKNPLRLSAGGNFSPAACEAFGGGPPASTVFVAAP